MRIQEIDNLLTSIAEATVERFDVGVLIRFTWLDQTQLHSVCMRPFQHCTSGELLPIAGPNEVGIAARLAEAIEDAHQVIATQSVFGMDNNPFDGRIIDDAGLAKLQIDHPRSVAAMSMRECHDLLSQRDVAIRHGSIAQRTRAHANDPKRCAL